MKKKEFPILEFDPDKEAFINPRMISDKYPKLPSHLLVCFFKDAIDKLFENEEIVHLTTLRGENDLEIFKFVHHDVALIPGKVGAPLCAGFMDECIALGSRYVMFCGGAGVLRADLAVGHLVVVDSAIRDEGTSYHYVKPSRIIRSDARVRKIIKQHLKTEKIDFIEGRTWTTDAFYRETKKKIKMRQEEGAIMVDMEQSAMIAVAKFRQVFYGAILYGGDDLSKEMWDGRDWSKREDIRLGLTRLCLDIVTKFDVLDEKEDQS